MKPLNPHELAELRHRLIDQLEHVVVAVLGEPKFRAKREWRWGSNNGSLAVVMSGSKRGMWCDRAALGVKGCGGDVFKLLDRDFGAAIERGCHLTGYNPPSRDAGLSDEQRRSRDVTAEHDRAVLASQIAERRAAAERRRVTEDAAAINEARQMVAALTAPSYPAKAYLASRSIPLDQWPAGLGYHPGERALIAAGTTRYGTVTCCQIVRLTPDGHKRAELSKQTFGRTNPTGTDPAYLRLPARVGGDRNVLCHAEGIETALSVWVSTNCETWVAFGSNVRPEPGRLNVILADDDAVDSVRAKSLLKQRETWDEAGFWYVVATPWEDSRGDRSDLNDTLKRFNPAAVRERIQLALLSRTWPPDFPPIVPPPPSPRTIRKDELDAEVTKPIADFLADGFETAIDRRNMLIRNAERSDGLKDRVPDGRQLLVQTGTATKKTAGYQQGLAACMAIPPDDGPPWRATILVNDHALGKDLEQRLEEAYPEIPRQVYQGADRPDPSAPDFNNPEVAHANKTKMCRRYAEASAVMKAGGSIETLCGSAKRGYCAFNPEPPNIREQDACGRKSTPVIDHGFLILAGPETLEKAPPASFQRKVSYRVPGSDERGEKKYKTKQLKIDVADVLIVDETKLNALLAGSNDDGTAYEVDIAKLSVPLPMFGGTRKPSEIDVPITDDEAMSRYVSDCLIKLDRVLDCFNPGTLRAIEVKGIHSLCDWGQVRRDAYKFKPQLEDFIRPDMYGRELYEALAGIGKHNAQISRIARLCSCILQAAAAVNNKPDDARSGHIHLINVDDGETPKHHLRLHWVSEVHADWRHIPTLWTDATADAEIMRRWVPNLEVTSNAVLETPECVNRRVVWNSAFSYRDWVPEDPEHPPLPGVKLARRQVTAWNNVKWLQRFLTVKLAQYRGQGRGKYDALVILPLGTELALRALWGKSLPLNLGIAHYGNFTGVNTFDGVRYACLVSRPLLPSHTLELMRATWAGVHGITVPDGMLPEIAAAYLMRDGSGRLAKVRRHPDPVTEQFRVLTLTGPLIQGECRPRGPWRAPETPLDIDHLCNEPLPLPVDELLTLNKLRSEGSVPRWLLAMGICPIPETKGFLTFLAAANRSSEEAVEHIVKRDHEWTSLFKQHLGQPGWTTFAISLADQRYAAQVQIQAGTVEEAEARLKAVGISAGVTGPPEPPRKPITVIDRMAARGLILFSPTHAALWYRDLFLSNGGEVGRAECARKAIKRSGFVTPEFPDIFSLKGAKCHISKKRLLPLWQMAPLREIVSGNWLGLFYRCSGVGQQGAFAIVSASRADTIRAEMEAILGAMEVFEIMPDEPPEPPPAVLTFPPTLVPTHKTPLWAPLRLPQAPPPLHIVPTPQTPPATATGPPW